MLMPSTPQLGFAGGFGFALGAANPAIARLQRAINALGAVTKSPALKLKVDGITGPNTARATNAALKYVKTPYRSVTPATLPKAAAAIASAIEAAVRAKGPAAAAASAPRPAAPRAPTGPAPGVTPKPPPTPRLTARANKLVQDLQLAVAALGRLHGDRPLQIKADGIMGPKTAAAVNAALRKYVVAAPPPMRRGNLSQKQIVTDARLILGFLTQTFGPQPPPTPITKVAGKPAPTSHAAIADLQRSVARLGQLTNDRILQIAADGKTGPKTAAAVNRALLRYVTTAPPQYRSGKLSPAFVGAQAMAIKPMIDAEASRRGSAPAPSVTTPESSGSPILDLQAAVASLGRLVKDRVLQIKADGKSGPKTAAAVNRALTKHVKVAVPGQLKSGKLSALDIRNQAPAILGVVNQEIARRGMTPAAAAPSTGALAPGEYGPEMPPGYTPPADAGPEPQYGPELPPGYEPPPDVAPAPAYEPEPVYTPPPAPMPMPAPSYPGGGGGGGGGYSPGPAAEPMPEYGPELPPDYQIPPDAAPAMATTGTFPVVPVLIGLAVAGAAILFLRKDDKPAEPIDAF